MEARPYTQHSRRDAYTSLSQPRRIRFRRCLFVCWQLCAKTSERICMKFSGKVGNGPVNNIVNVGGDPDHRLDISGFITILGDTESG